MGPSILQGPDPGTGGGGGVSHHLRLIPVTHFPSSMWQISLNTSSRRPSLQCQQKNTICFRVRKTQVVKKCYYSITSEQLSEGPRVSATPVLNVEVDSDE